MDADVLKSIYERYSREIYLYLLGICGSRAEAEELMQETFLNALESLGEDHTNVRAWLYTVARNLFYDRARRGRFEFSAERPPAEGFAPSAEEELIKRQRAEDLAAALARLDERKRDVISLQYLSGLSVCEIAAVMGLSQENVRVLAFRAKRELRSILEENGYGLQ